MIIFLLITLLAISEASTKTGGYARKTPEDSNVHQQHQHHQQQQQQQQQKQKQYQQPLYENKQNNLYVPGIDYDLDEIMEDDDPIHSSRSLRRGFPMRSHHREDVMQQHHAMGGDSVFAQSYGDVRTFGETRDFLQFLRRIKYDHRQCPENNNGQAVTVEVSVVVSNIRAVSEVTMDYALELFYRESWLDSRLQFDKTLFKNKTKLALHESYTNFLWFPDTFVPNAIASKNPQKNSISHRSLLRLEENGQLLYSRRISLICECTMDLTLFPFDKQLCKLGIESYGYTADQVMYKWSTGSRSALKLMKIRLPDFTIKEAYVTSQTEVYATGNYSRLYVCFVFSRSSGFCFLQLIIPSTAVVITSWVSLWMESETEFQDMISIILAITFLIFSYNEMMPRVSYIKAMDIYLGVCFMIVFLSLIKLAFVKYMRQRIKVADESPHNLVNQMMLHTRTVNGLIVPAARGNNNVILRNGKKHKCEYQTVSIGDEADSVSEEQYKGKLERLLAGMEFRFTKRSMHRFQWISQMLFFFGFIIFCLFYFLIYPNLHIVSIDPACDKQLAEWFAEII